MPQVAWDDQDIVQKGLIIRHLILPGQSTSQPSRYLEVEENKRIVD
jgi:uncharacterized Fe-S radical SAM superfamily protein PflX